MHSVSAYIFQKRLNVHLIESGGLMTKKQKKNLIRIIVSAVLMVVFIFIPVDSWMRFAMFMIPYLIIGYDILIKAAKGVIHLQPFDECFLMSVATIGAMIIAVTGHGDYVEAIAVMLFYQTGEWFQSYAVGKSRKSISDLMDICPEYANVETADGQKETDPEDVEIGTVIVIKAGERIPIDGVVISGSSMLDTSALTGESVPRSVHEGDEVISGCVNGSGVLRVKTTKLFEDSTVSRILELVENASSRKSGRESFITRFARVYTPVVVLSALALAIIPPLISLLISGQPHWAMWIYRALTFLVISCPCALVISVPLSFFAGIGGAGKQGILIKGSNYLEMLSKAGTVIFDKTGTLTKGVFEVTEICPDGATEDELLLLAAAAEQYSGHPIALSLLKRFNGRSELPKAEDVSEVAGKGITARIGKSFICVGNSKLMQDNAKGFVPSDKSGTVVYVSRDGQYIGHIVISDIIKENSAKALKELKKTGIRRTVMLTGDSKKAADAAAQKLGLDDVYSELLPEDKVRLTGEIIEKSGKGEAVVFVGDGINDAPVLTEADIGIAMGAMGSDAAIEASDIVLMDDDPLKISTAIGISKKCIRIVNENIWFSIGVKAICLILGALGFANMWIAVFADVGVMVIAVLNAMRNLIQKKK